MKIADAGFAVLLILATATVVSAESPPLEAWVYSWNGPANLDDFGLLATFDPDGFLYVAGTTYEGGVGGHREDFILTRFDAAGTVLWTRQLYSRRTTFTAEV